MICGQVGVGLDLAAQAADLHVDRAVEQAGGAAAGVLEQEVAREHAARVVHEHAQQVELAAREHHGDAVGAVQLARAFVEGPAGEAPARCRVRPHGRAAGGAGGVMRRSTALMRATSSRRSNGLRHVVVGTHLQAHDLVDRIAPAGDDHEAALPVLAQLAGDREAVLAGQAEVEQHEGGRVRRPSAASGRRRCAAA